MVHLPTSRPLLLHHKSNITLIVNFAPADLSSKQITHCLPLSTKQSTCQPLCHLWVQVPQRKSPRPQRSSAAHRQVVIVIIINHGRDHRKWFYPLIKWWSMSTTMMIRVFWHLIPPSSLVLRLIHMASSVQPVKQQGMLPAATNRTIINGLLRSSLRWWQHHHQNQNQRQNDWCHLVSLITAALIPLSGERLCKSNSRKMPHTYQLLQIAVKPPH